MKFNLGSGNIVLTSAFLLVVGTNSFPYFNKVVHKNFDWKLTKEILNDGCKDCNVIISPYSTKMMLSLASFGINPESNSRHEISNAVSNFTMEQEEFHYWMSTLDSLNTPSKEYSVSLASEICYDKTVSVLHSYKALVQDVYKVNVKKLDFSDAVNSASEINKFVSEQTKGRINNFITPEGLRDINALLLSAVYFDGKWEHPFSKSEYLSNEFKITPDKVVKVEMMSHENKKHYYTISKELNAEIVRLSYKGNKYAMNIIFPNETDGLQSVIEKLSAETLNEELSNLEKIDMRLEMPRFKFDYRVKLKEHLQNLGIRQIFTENADIIGLQSKHGLKVSDVIQKAEIAVDEEGTIASGATEIDYTDRMLPAVTLTINHPFLFFIEDETTGVILFAGKVQHPEFK